MSRLKILLSRSSLTSVSSACSTLGFRQPHVDAVLEHDVPAPLGDENRGAQLVADRGIFVEQRQEILGPGLGADAHDQRQLGEMLPGIGLDHGAVVGDHLDLAVALPEREGVALGHRDMQPARIELEHGGIGDPGVGLEPRPRLAGVEEQQRRPPGDAGGVENVLAASARRWPASAIEVMRKPAEVGDGVAEIAEFRHDHRQMPAADGAVGDARQHERQRGGDAGAARQPPASGRPERSGAKRART